MEAIATQRLLEIRRIGYAEILDAPESAALLKEYAAECSIPEIGEINPQRDTYAQIEKSGLMHSFGVFDDKTLVGFATILLFVLPHYGKKIANVESLFVAQAQRASRIGLRLMDTIERYAMESDCVAMLYNARAGGQLERLLSVRSPYKRTNSVFLRSFA